MTREEKIDLIKMAYDEDLRYDPRICFEEGIEWADANPKSPWISVKDDLPCNNTNNIHFGFTNNVLATDGENIFTMYMKKCNDKWIWCVDNVDLSHSITHWMTIPKLPKSSN